MLLLLISTVWKATPILLTQWSSDAMIHVEQQRLVWSERLLLDQ